MFDFTRKLIADVYEIARKAGWWGWRRGSATLRSFEHRFGGMDEPKWPERFTPEEMKIVRESLEAMLKIDQSLAREPEGYEGENPQDHPPPVGWEMRKVA